MTTEVIIAAIAAIFGGGLIAGIAVLLKVRPESGQIVVTAAQGAVIVQSAVIDDLTEEMQRQRGRVDDLQRDLIDAVTESVRLRQRVQTLEGHVRSVEAERDRYRKERDELRSRIESLESEIARMKEETG